MTIPAVAPVAPVVPVVPVEPVVPVVPAVIPSAPVEPVVPVVPVAEPAVAASAFEPTGDTGLDLAAKWVTDLGIAKDDPAIKAALEEGNFDFLKAKLASLGDKARGWEQYIALAEKGLGNLQATADAEAAVTNTLVYAAVGGEEVWGRLAEWAGANADQGEKDSINSMLSAGGIQAQAAAQYLHGLYAKASGTVVEPSAATAATPASFLPDNSALTAAQYSAEVRKLAAKMGAHRMDNSPEYLALQDRRRAYKG